MVQERLIPALECTNFLLYDCVVRQLSVVKRQRKIDVKYDT